MAVRAVKKKKTIDPSLREQVEIGVLVLDTEEVQLDAEETELRYINKYYCSCGHESRAEFDSRWGSKLYEHTCPHCDNKLFYDTGRVDSNNGLKWRNAKPIFFDQQTSTRGFDVKRTNVSFEWDSATKKVTILKQNMVRRYIFDWVDRDFRVYKDGELEYDFNATDDKPELKQWETVKRISRFLTNDMEIKEVIREMKVPNPSFYEYIHYQLRERPHRSTTKQLGEELHKALQEHNFRELNWANILSSAGFTNLERFRDYNRGWGVSRTKVALNREETKPHKILGVPKWVVSYVRDDSSVETRHLGEIQKVRDVAPNKLQAMRALFDYAVEEHLLLKTLNNIDKWFKLIDRYNYDVKRLAEYIFHDVKFFQGIDDMEEALTLLHDKADMNRKMGADVEKYPDSLKREHDIATLQYKAFKHEVDHQEFRDAVELYQDLAETEMSKIYSIVTPKDSKEIVNEGKTLSHCVSSYTEKVAKQQTGILFLRGKKEIETPMVTIEVNNGQVRQARGKYNRKLEELEAKYVRAWAKEKGLVYNG